MDRALDLHKDKSVSHIYKRDVLTAMPAWKRIWQGLSPDVIANYWRCTGVLVESDSSSINMFQTEQANLELTMQSFIPARVQKPVSDLLNPEKEDYCYENVSNAGLVQEITFLATQKDAMSDEEGDAEVRLPPIGAQLQALALCKRLSDSMNMSNAIRGALISFQREVQRIHQSKMRQTTIDSFL